MYIFKDSKCFHSYKLTKFSKINQRDTTEWSNAHAKPV